MDSSIALVNILSAIVLVSLWSVVIFKSWKITKILGNNSVWFGFITAFVLILARCLLLFFSQDSTIIIIGWIINFAVPVVFIYSLNKFEENADYVHRTKKQ